MHELEEKLKRKASSSEKLNLLYMWIKQDYITLAQFKHLITLC